MYNETRDPKQERTRRGEWTAQVSEATARELLTGKGDYGNWRASEGMGRDGLASGRREPKRRKKSERETRRED